MANSLTDAYGGQGGAVAGVTTTAQPSSLPAVHDNYDAHLPFTGLDVFLIVGGGLIALAAGFLLRRGQPKPN